MGEFEIVEIPSVIPRFLEVCPAFRPRWEAHLAYWGDESRGDYLDVSELAHFVIDSYVAGDVALLPPIFEAAEAFLSLGHPNHKEMIVIGLLEDIQTISTHHSFEPDAFLTYLGRLSREAWQDTARAWDRKSSLMDVVRSERQHQPPQ